MVPVPFVIEKLRWSPFSSGPLSFVVRAARASSIVCGSWLCFCFSLSDDSKVWRILSKCSSSLALFDCQKKCIRVVESNLPDTRNQLILCLYKVLFGDHHRYIFRSSKMVEEICRANRSIGQILDLLIHRSRFTGDSFQHRI